MHDLIVIGGGAAGLSASIYARGKQLDTLVIAEELGGKAGWLQQLAEMVPEAYLAGVEAVRMFARRVSARADGVLRDRVVEVSLDGAGFQVETQRPGCREARTIIVATSATPLLLDVPGARTLLGQGLGYSITTHAPLLAGKIVAVFGDTVRALRGVAELARTAKQVYLITADGFDQPGRVDQTLRNRSNVAILEGYEIKEVVGEYHVERLLLERNGDPSWLTVDAAFVDLGLLPNSAMVHQITQIDAEGFIVVDERNATSVPGLFATGDMSTAFGEQFLIAMGDGARAALSAYDYILSYEERVHDPN